MYRRIFRQSHFGRRRWRRLRGGSANELCKHCHFDMYTKSLEGIHRNLLKQGTGYAWLRRLPRIAPDHFIQPRPGGKRGKVGECHAALYASYASRCMRCPGQCEQPGRADLHRLPQGA